jgi:hypothetical protein
MWLWADNTATTLFLAGLLLVVLTFLRRGSRKLRRGPSVSQRLAARAAEAAAGAGIATTADTPAHLARWEIELHELAREATAQVDTKLRLLQEYLRAADEQAQRLESLLTRAAEVGAAPEAWTWQPAAERNLDSGLPLEQAAARLRTAPRGAPRPRSDGDSTRQRQIYSLADSGLGSRAIAQQTGYPIGEVELVLSLRGRA